MDALNSKIEIADLINRWAFYRDQERWDELAGTFHDDGAISISWFDGPHKVFVAASQKMAANKNAQLKHLLGVPAIKVVGDRAISEVNVSIMVRVKTPVGDVDSTSYARFYDQVERRNGQWKIAKRTAIYEKDRIDPVTSATLPDAVYQGLEQFPVEVKFLASNMKRNGIELSKTIVLDKSAASEAVYQAGNAWLAGK